MKAILFDAGNTLVWLDHPFLLETLRRHGVETTSPALLAAEYEAKRALDALFRAGRGGDDESRGRVFFREVFRAVGLPDAALEEAGTRLRERHAQRNLWCVVKERTAETLEELRGRGFRLGVVSNADGRVDALLGDVGLRGWFDVVLDSAVVGIEKPDPEIFRRAAAALGVDPWEAAYVGDVYEIDVVGARAAGMRPFLVDPLGLWGEMECERIEGIHDLPAIVGSPS